MSRPHGTAPRLDPFRVLSRRERELHRAAYLRHLAERNGTPDLARRTLSRRERFFAEIAAKPVSWDGDVDHAGFFAHFTGRGRPEIDARTIWLLALAKANEGESYGVERELKAVLAHGPERVDPEVVHVMLEEQYHGRLLVEACRTCALDVTLQRPRWAQRWIIHLFQTLPERLRWIPVLTGEIVGYHLFELLRENSRLFSAQPEVEERLRFLLGEICIDEALHVAFLRARLQPWALRIARAMLVPAATVLFRGMPPLQPLGCEFREFLQRVRSGVPIPPALDWIQPDLR